MPSLTITEADDELLKAVALEQEIQEELSQLETQLAEAESTAGDRCLAARKVGDTKQIQKINDGVLKLRNQYDVTSKTLQAARAAIKAARHEINMARGQDLRAQAAVFMEEAGKRQQKTNELLAALFEHEGIRYLQEPQTRGGACLEGTIAESKTQKLAQEAAALIRQAEITENQIVRVEPDPHTTGRVSGAVHIQG